MSELNRRVGIHVHGRHLQAVEAEAIMWGRPPHQLGQLTLALRILAEYQPGEVVSFSIGTGASKKDGLLEAEYWGKMVAYRLSSLKDFAAFRSVDLDDLAVRVATTLFLEKTSQNTVQEAQKLAELGSLLDFTDLVVVSAPTHLSRIVVDVLKVLDSDPGFTKMRENVQFRASDVPYAGCTVGDVVVVEPPHRGDDTSPPLYKLIPRYFRIPADKKHSFYDRFDQLLKEFGS